MKLAVCEKLSGEISIQNGKFYWITPYYGCFDESDKIKWLTEGLQVCNEAEKLLTDGHYQDYRLYLWQGTGRTARGWLSATYEQRLEALCRVWYPEKFTSET